MIRARADRPGKPSLAILGITAENVKRLKEGKPILVEGATIGIDVDISIAYGETEADIVREMREAGLSLELVFQPRGGSDG